MRNVICVCKAPVTFETSEMLHVPGLSFSFCVSVCVNELQYIQGELFNMSEPERAESNRSVQNFLTYIPCTSQINWYKSLKRKDLRIWRASRRDRLQIRRMHV